MFILKARHIFSVAAYKVDIIIQTDRNMHGCALDGVKNVSIRAKRLQLSQNFTS